jgi:hypothetical protein
MPFGSFVPVFFEKYLLPTTVALTVLVVFTNPMKLDWTQRITGGLALVFASYFVAHTVHKINQPKSPIESQSAPSPTVNTTNGPQSPIMPNNSGTVTITNEETKRSDHPPPKE